MSHSVTVSSSLNLPTAETPLLDAVRMYAEQGFIPIPMRYRTKAPKSNGWQRAAPGVDAALERFEGWSTANIGLVMGGPLRLVAIDVDGDEGRSTKAALEAKHGVWPRTLRGRSGRADGGTHYVYRIPETRDIARFGCRSLGKNIQTRGPGGQIVACPSHHKDTGRPYAWDHVAPIADAPDWMIDMLEERRPKAKVLSISTRLPITEDRRTGALDRAIQTVCAEIINTPQGGRHEVVKRKAMFVLRKVAGLGLGLDPYIDQLRVATQVGGFHDSSVDSLLGWCASKAIAEPDSDDAWQPYTMQPGPQQDRAIHRALERPVVTEDWQSGLHQDKHGKIMATEGNLTRILESHPLFAGKFEYNLDSLMPEYEGATAYESVMFELRARLSDELVPFGCSFKKELFEEAVLYEARKHEYSPVRRYLDTLVWDGTSRIGSVCSAVLKRPGNSETESDMLMRWLVSAVARAMEPGCKVDSVLILAGPQGIRKSTFFATLFGEFFSHSHIDFSNKDGVLQLHSAWGHELQEVDQYTRGVAANKLKGILSTTIDTIRVPYGKVPERMPRRFVVAGTTNEDEILVDPTGARRFWIIACLVLIDIDTLAGWRDQLWAEAVHLYRTGVQYHNVSGAELISSQYQVSDYMAVPIQLWLEARGNVPFVTDDVITEVFGSVPITQIDTRFRLRVTSILRTAGNRPKHIKLHGKTVKMWTRLPVTS